MRTQSLSAETLICRQPVSSLWISGVWRASASGAGSGAGFIMTSGESRREKFAIKARRGSFEAL